MNQTLSNIHPEAKIGKNVTIDAFTTICKDVEIGEGTWIGPNVTIFDGARIGKNCKIFPGAVISGVPQDLKFDGEETTAEIGDNTTIREYVTISRGTKDKWKTIVGSNCLLMAYVHIAHDVKVGDNCILGNAAQFAGHAVIGDWAIISGGSLIHQFSHLGSHVMIGGGSKIRKDVPPYIMAGREPLSYSGVNSVGLKRRGYSNEMINAIQDTYRAIYMSGLPITKGVDKAEEEIPQSEERDTIISFFRNSERGVIKGYSKG